MPKNRFLFVTALVEAGAGLALLLAPRVFVDLLLGIAQPAPEALLVGRVGGAALLALAIACWLARTDPGSPSQRGLVYGMLLYNVAVGIILAYAGSMLQMTGIALWPAVVLHAALAVWSLFCLRAPREAL